MSKKKTVLVETSKQGKQWSIKVTSTIPEFHDQLARFIHGFCDTERVSLLNASDPFGNTISKRKRRIHKPVMGQPDEETMQHLHERLTRELKS